jgi:hypothetical protein
MQQAQFLNNYKRINTQAQLTEYQIIKNKNYRSLTKI